MADPSDEDEVPDPSDEDEVPDPPDEDDVPEPPDEDDPSFEDWPSSPDEWLDDAVGGAGGA